MNVYIEIPVSEETVEELDVIMERENLENHNAVINFIIGKAFINKAREEGE